MLHKILVIEDEMLVRENILERLEVEGFDTISASNGVEGVHLAQTHYPDLIICDVMMPELDGYGVLSKLRYNLSTATIPFIFLTAKADKVDLRQGMELGADDYLTKPFTKNELLGAITTRLDKRAEIAQQSEKKLDQLRKSITHALPQQILTPLSEIIGFAQMLSDNYDAIKPPEILATAQNLNTSAVRLNRLVENFIMYAQIESLATNQAEIQAISSCQTFNAGDVISAQATHKAKQYRRELDLSLRLVNTTVRIAQQDLKKVVEELVDNAFKFSLPGTPVEVKAMIDQDSFNLKITNFGQVMTLEQINSIGGYMRFDNATYDQQGLGLGLAIAKRIAELHGGKLSIQSGHNQTTLDVKLRR